jgi:hypothetical protein
MFKKDLSMHKTFVPIVLQKIIERGLMHTPTSIQNIFKKSFNVIHKKRADSLIAASEGLLNGAHLTVSSIGRHLPGNALEKSKIYRANSIIGNGSIYRDKLLLTRSLVNLMFSNRATLYVLIDWSGCCSDKRHILQASIANNGLGRSQPIHSRVHGKSEGEWVKAQKIFLDELKFIFSDIKANIVVITDSGFHAPWFKDVERLGWDYIGRVRGTVTICFEGVTKWNKVDELYQKATGTPQSLGKGTLGKDKKNSIVGSFYLVKKKKLGRKKPANKRKYPDQERQYEQMYRDPWLLISSIKTSDILKIIQAYAYRMQIEQNFRDIKNSNYGYGLEHSGTKDRIRLENLLLIALIATFMAFIIGLCAENCKLHWTFQANTVRHKRTLSLVYLGIRVWQTSILKIPISLIEQGFLEFSRWDGELIQNG